LPDLDSLAGQGNNALDKQFRAVERVIEDHDLTALDRAKMIGNPIDENCLVIGEQRSHTVALDCERLISENHDRGDGTRDQ
jgi:hypothetical protein